MLVLARALVGCDRFVDGVWYLCCLEWVWVLVNSVVVSFRFSEFEFRFVCCLC